MIMAENLFTGKANLLQHLGKGRGKLVNPAHLEEAMVSLKPKTDEETVFRVNFDKDELQDILGVVLIRNMQHAEFFLKMLTLEGVPDKGTVVFVIREQIVVLMSKL